MIFPDELSQLSDRLITPDRIRDPPADIFSHLPITIDQFCVDRLIRFDPGLLDEPYYFQELSFLLHLIKVLQLME
jgi:hypothetical protein